MSGLPQARPRRGRVDGARDTDNVTD